MKKKLLALFLTLTMLLTVIPAMSLSASAEDPTYDYGLFLGKDGAINKVAIRQVDEWTTVVEAGDALNPENFSGLSWDGTNKHWVMNNFEFKTSAGYGVVFAADAYVDIEGAHYTVLEIKGENTIQSGENGDNSCAVCCLGSEIHFEISGNGTLNASSASSASGVSVGLSADGQESCIVIDNGVSVNAIGGEEAYYDNCGIKAYNGNL